MENLQIEKPSYSLINKDSMLQLATELSKLIKEKGLSSNIQGKQFVNVEGWQFCGASLGLMPIITDTKDLSNETTIKYMATCEVRNINTGAVVATGIALCTNAEKTKKYFDEYAILSMAQTRAIGKAYRNLLAWLMKAAGFEATPAEEMDFATVQTGASVHEEPKKTSKSVQEVVVEIIEEGDDLDKIKMEIAKATKLKQLTDLYYGYKQLFDSDPLMMKLLSMKKENLK